MKYSTLTWDLTRLEIDIENNFGRVDLDVEHDIGMEAENDAGREIIMWK